MSTQISISPVIKLEVNTTPITGGSAGQILFQTTGNTVGESSNLFWDNTNAYLNLGATGTFNTARIVFNQPRLSAINGIVWADNIASPHGFIALDRSSGEFRWSPSSGGYFPTIYSNGSEAMRIATTRNVLIGTTTDAGFKLDVNGTGRFQNTLKLSNNITASTQNGYFEGNTAGNITNTTAVFNFQYPTSATSGTMFQFSDSLNTGYVSDLYGNKDILRVFGGFKNPNSAWVYSDIKIDPTYQGVGSGTIVRGIYYNPTNSLTGSYTLRAIETTTGDVLFGNGSLTISSSGPTFNMNVLNNSQISAIYMNATDGNPRGGLYTNINTGEVRLIAGTGGYFQTFYNSGSEVMRLISGNLLIGTTTNAGYRLDVNGTARVSGLVTANGYRVATNGEGLTAASATVGIVSYGANGAASGYTFTLNNGYGGGNINRNFFAVGDNFYLTSAFSSGTNTTNWFGVYPVINNTGGTTTSRGFYYNPTLTNTTGTTHFAFHSTSGRVRFENLPTSSAGLSAGDIWNDAGTLKIV